MDSGFQKITSKVFLVIFIGFIIVSFMFSDFGSMGGGQTNVAKVDSYPISAKEYQAELNRQIQMYQNFTGGQPLTSQQLEQFGVRRSALNSLVQKKLIQKFADNLDMASSPEEIKKVIKELPYFQTNNSFDTQKYKNLLAANQFSPKEFEQNIADDLRVQAASNVASQFSVSNAVVKDIIELKNQKAAVHIAEVNKGDLLNFVEVTSPEIDSYLSEAANLARVKSLFNERKEELTVKESLKTKHILLRSEGDSQDVLKKAKDIQAKLTRSNFSTMANKYTEDPSGKDNGGDLPLFSRGQMVPEFEKAAFAMKPGQISAPVKTQFGYHIILLEKKTPRKEAFFDEHKVTLAKELIRQSKTSERDQLYNQIISDIETYLKEDKFSEVEKVVQKYKLNYEDDVLANPYSGLSGQIKLETENQDKLFSSLSDQAQTFVFKSPTNAKIVWARDFKGETQQTSLEKERETMIRNLSSRLRQSIVSELQENADLKVYTNI